jgi:GNAT superfamily N-acetyltransferase
LQLAQDLLDTFIVNKDNCADIEVKVMNFTVELNRCNDVCFDFYDDECSPVDLLDGEPYRISGAIKDDGGNQIGNFFLYELDNDSSFWDKCDIISGDCEIIASTVCGERGKILKKYIPTVSEFETVLVLDKIEINKNFRGNGIGTSVIRKLLYMMNYQFDSCKAIFLCASDYESADKYGFDSEEYREGTKKLVEFYKKLGFKVVKNNVMVYFE